MPYRVGDGVQDGGRGAQQVAGPVAFGPFQRGADDRVGEGGEDRPDAFGESPGAVQLYGAAPGLTGVTAEASRASIRGAGSNGATGSCRSRRA